MEGKLDFWLWPLIIRLIGEENARKLLYILGLLATLVEGDPEQSDGQGREKKKMVAQTIIAWLDSKGLWSHYWLHVHIWTSVLNGLIDRVVKLLKDNNWKNPFAEPAGVKEDPDLQAAIAVMAKTTMT